jgi:hypothetical protein
MTELLSGYIVECNEWLVAPENEKAPKFLRDLMIATRGWVEECREIAR